MKGQGQNPFRRPLINGAVRMKLKMQQRPQEVRDARNVECIEEKCRQQIEPAQERPCRLQLAKLIGTGMPKPFGTHVLPPSAPDAIHGGIGFNVCSAGFQS
jgi:hypothetical protein